MIVTCVHVKVKTEFIDDFVKATVENHYESIKEEGNLSFDILQEDGNPSKFLLYEAYASEEASAKHKETKHYLKWRETVAHMMAEPRQGIKHKVICPKTPEEW